MAGRHRAGALHRRLSERLGPAGLEVRREEDRFVVLAPDAGLQIVLSEEDAGKLLALLDDESWNERPGLVFSLAATELGIAPEWIRRR